MLRNVCQLIFSQGPRQTLGSRSAPFEHIQSGFRVVVSLVTAIAKVDDWSSSRSGLPMSIVQERNIGCSRRVRCGQGSGCASEQQ